ncbi:hypothetical protein HYDPIDRAFT_82870 [Hydnomerulius pinastri MD-312]|nr:hypothetical protein HYDPIDRAFT_82870 [Hydnomerulius pinastri MD-312]
MPSDVTSVSGHLTGLQKKQNQWRRWSQDIVPALIRPYLAYLQCTEQLWSPKNIQAENPDCPSCTNNCVQCSLMVTCILFDYVTIKCCTCCPSPVTLIARGLFAYSPVAPSIAVDLWVLELVKKLFVHMTLNTTAWCKALESFLDGQGYKLKTKVS